MKGGGGVFTLRSFHTSSLPAPDLHLFTCPNCNNKVDKERTYEVKYKHILPTFKTTEGVPRIFLEYYPKISVADYKLMKSDAQFLERKARVCDSCYIDFTQVHQNGARPRPKVRTSPTLSRSLSSSGSSMVPTSPPLSRSDSSSKHSTISNSPPTSPLYSNSPKAPHLHKSSPPPIKKSTSPNGTSHSLSPPSTFSSAPKRTLKNGTYKETYYLNLYDELDSLRKEIHTIKTNEENSIDDLTNQLKEKDEEWKTQRKAYITKAKQESQHKDEKIKELQTTIELMQQDHANAIEAIEREYEKKMEHKLNTFEAEQDKLKATIEKLQKEIEEVKTQSEERLTTDRSEVLVEVEKLKQKSDMEKVVEKEQLRTKFREDLELTRKKNEEKSIAFRQQITELEAALTQERKEKEKAIEERKEMAKQMELLKARSRVS